MFKLILIRFRKLDTYDAYNMMGGTLILVRLRPYKDCDAQYLLNWIEDEKSFVKWCANHFQYPLTTEQCIEYRKKHEDKLDSWIFTALDESGNVIGHILFDKMNLEENTVHLGHVIVDTTNRGNGIGKEMLKLSLIYAFHVLKVDKVTLSVFDNNQIAYNCYKSIGFNVYEYYPECYPYKDEKWGCYYMQIIREDLTLSMSQNP